jgi:sugar phosphate isomerase/epimerase
MKNTRRKFIKISGVLIPSLLVYPEKQIERAAFSASLSLGIASYSFRNYDLDETIQMTRRLNIKHLALKSMHLPLETSDTDIGKIKTKLYQAGINLYGAGVIYMNSMDDVKNAFRYAKAAELKVIIGVPKHELLDQVEDLVKQTNIKVAIHNHGPGDELYPSPQSVIEKIKNRDPRLGLCMDIGHTQRIGLDPGKEAKKYFSRLLDVHIKDVDQSSPDGDTVEIGRGVIDIPGFLSVLYNHNYTGMVSFEYEKDPDDVLPGISESIGYVRGVLDAGQKS